MSEAEDKATRYLAAYQDGIDAYGRGSDWGFKADQSRGTGLAFMAKAIEADTAQVVPQPDRERLAQRILDTMLRSYSPPNGGALAYELADAVLAALSTQPAVGDDEGYVALRDLIDECMDDALHDSEMTPAELLSTVVWDHGYRRADQGDVLGRQPSPELAELFPGTLAALDRLSIRPEVQS